MSERKLTDEELSSVLSKKEGKWKDCNLTSVKNAKRKFEVGEQCEFEEYIDKEGRPIFIARCKNVECRLKQKQSVR